MSRTADLKENRPDLYEDEQVRLFAEQGDRLHKLKALHDTEGGQELTAILMQEVRSRVYQLASKHKEMSREELDSICSEMNAFLQTARVLRNAKGNMEEMDKELETALA